MFHRFAFLLISRYPDTFLYNTADNAGFLLPQDSQNVIVSHNGTVFWPLPLAQLRTRCRMVIKYFPFGKHYYRCRDKRVVIQLIVEKFLERRPLFVSTKNN